MAGDIKQVTQNAVNIEPLVEKQINDLRTYVDGLALGGGDVDLSNYYTKLEVDGAFATITALNLKADITVVDTALALKADKTYVDTQDALKADKATTYTKEEVDAIVDGLSSGDADLTNYYTKAEVDTKDSAKFDKAGGTINGVLTVQAEYTNKFFFNGADAVNHAILQSSPSGFGVVVHVEGGDKTFLFGSDGTLKSPSGNNFATVDQLPTAPDLTNYYTKAEVYNKGEMDTALAAREEKGACYTKAESDAKFALITALALKSDKTYVDTELGKKLNLAGGTLTGQLNATSIIASGEIKSSTNVTAYSGATYQNITVDEDTDYYTKKTAEHVSEDGSIVETIEYYTFKNGGLQETLALLTKEISALKTKVGV